MRVVRLASVLAVTMVCLGQDTPTLIDPAPAPAAKGEKSYSIPSGTHVLMTVVSTTSTKNASPGDWVYLETTFPVAANGRIVIPQGSFVTGTVTLVQRPGKVKGKGELGVRFDQLMLPNGTTRDFRASVAGLDGNAPGRLDKEEGVITGEGGKGQDARTIGTGAGIGAGVGGIGGAIGGSSGMGAGIGGAAGALGGLVGVLLSRGPDAVLAQGTRIQMELDRDLMFYESELMPVGMTPNRQIQSAPPPPQNGNNRQNQQQTTNPIGIPGMGRIPRFP